MRWRAWFDSAQTTMARQRTLAGMTRREEISALQERIARSETERDAWRSSGLQEKYLEAYSMVDALELQLDRLRASRSDA